MYYSKGASAHLFVNLKNLDYIGPAKAPDMKYFALSNITNSEYQSIVCNNWNLKMSV